MNWNVAFSSIVKKLVPFGSDITELHSLKQQKFRGWKVSRFAGFIRYVGKSFAIFSITTFVHSWFSNPTKQLRAFQRKLHFLHVNILLKTVLRILGNGQQYITDRHMCVQNDHNIHSHRNRRGNYSWSESEMEQITNHFFVSFFGKLLPNLSSRFFTTTVEYFLKIFHGVNFLQSKSVAGEKFCDLLIIHKNCKSFVTVKLLLFIVCL